MPNQRPEAKIICDPETITEAIIAGIEEKIKYFEEHTGREIEYYTIDRIGKNLTLHVTYYLKEAEP